MAAILNDDDLLMLFGQLHMRRKLQFTCLSQRCRQLFRHRFPMLLINNAYQHNEMAFSEVPISMDCACSEYNKHASLRQLQLVSICLYEKDDWHSILKLFPHLARSLRCLVLITGKRAMEKGLFDLSACTQLVHLDLRLKFQFSNLDAFFEKLKASGQIWTNLKCFSCNAEVHAYMVNTVFPALDYVSCRRYREPQEPTSERRLTISWKSIDFCGPLFDQELEFIGQHFSQLNSLKLYYNEHFFSTAKQLVILLENLPSLTKMEFTLHLVRFSFANLCQLLRDSSGIAINKLQLICNGLPIDIRNPRMDMLNAAKIFSLSRLQACRPPITDQDMNCILIGRCQISPLTLKHISWLHANGTLRKYTQLYILELDLDLAELSAEELQTFPVAWQAFLTSISEARLTELTLRSVSSKAQHLLDSLLNAVYPFTDEVELLGSSDEKSEETSISLSAIVPKVLPMLQSLSISHLSLNYPSELLAIVDDRTLHNIYLYKTSLAKLDQKRLMDIMKAKAERCPAIDFEFEYLFLENDVMKRENPLANLKYAYSV